MADTVDVIKVGRFYRPVVNGVELYRSVTKWTDRGIVREEQVREFRTKEDAWRFLRDRQETYEKREGRSLGWVIPQEVGAQ